MKSKFLLCANCFNDEGLRIDAQRIGEENNSICSNCTSNKGNKLDADNAMILAGRFFVRGTYHKTEYGGAPIIEMNAMRKTEIIFNGNLDKDSRLLSEKTGFGFFYYAPHTGMIGVNDYLDALENINKRAKTINEIIELYPTRIINEKFYRIRLDPQNSKNNFDYDAPPPEIIKRDDMGRLNDEEFPVLYGSTDLDTCIHETKISALDNPYVATLHPSRPMKLLDLAEILYPGDSKFDEIDFAIHFLFQAPKHAYEICRDIAKAARMLGYDGIIFPSFYSEVKTGYEQNQMFFGMPTRRDESMIKYNKSITCENIAIFGFPIKDGLLEVKCINRLRLNQVSYDYCFGPVHY